MIIKTVLSFVLICCMPLAQAGSACKNPEIHLTTSLGAVEIDLSPELPASTLNWLETLVKGPVFNPALIS